MNYFKATMLCVLMLLPIVATSKSKEVDLSDKEVSALQKKLSANKNLHVKFYRIKKNVRGRVTKSRGEAWFSQPSMFRWLIKDPLPEEFIFNGETAVQYQEAERFAISCKTTEGMGRGLDKIVSFVLDFQSLQAFYDLVSAKKTKRNTVQIVLKPRNPGQIEKVSLTASLQLNYVQEVTLFYPQGRQTQFKFVKPIFKAIKKSMYQFKASKGVRLRRCR